MITSALNNSASAMTAHGTKMAVTANNVANVNTDEFKSSRALIEEGQVPESVRVSISKDETQGPLVTESRNGETVETELSNTDIARELTSTIPTQRGYEANARTIRTQDEMLGTVIDMVA